MCFILPGVFFTQWVVSLPETNLEEILSLKLAVHNCRGLFSIYIGCYCFYFLIRFVAACCIIYLGNMIHDILFLFIVSLIGNLRRTNITLKLQIVLHDTCTEQSPYLEADSPLAGEEIPHLLLELEI
jgi:hypothetical protein